MGIVHDPALKPTLIVTDLLRGGKAWPTDWVSLIEGAIWALPGRRVTESIDGQSRSFGVATIYFPEGEYVLSRSLRIPVDVPVRLVGAHPTLSRIRLATSIVSDAADFDPIMPNAESTPVLPPPYLPPQFRQTASGLNATFYAGGMVVNSDWKVPGTALTWESLWSEYFEYVDSHYAIYFTGLQRAGAVVASGVVGLPKKDFKDTGWDVWLKRGLLNAGDGDSPWGVENLTFIGGGLLVAGNGGTSWGGGGQRSGAVERCDFEDTVAWGVATEDQRVVNVNIKDSRFTRCAGGVGVRYAQCDLWTLEDCDFHQTRGIDVLIASGSVVLEGCRFTGREAQWAAQPFVHIRTLPAVNELPGAAYAGTVAKLSQQVSEFRAEAWPGATHAGRGIRLIDCTFGADGWCPETMVLVGPSQQRPSPALPDLTPAFPLLQLARITVSPAIPGADGSMISSIQWAPASAKADPIPARESVGLHCEGCRFGSNELPTGAVVPRSAFRFDTSVQDCTIVRAMAGRMTWFIHEAMQEAVWEVSFAAAKDKKNIALEEKATYDALEQLVAMNWGNTLEVLSMVGGPSLPSLEPFSLGGRGWETSGEVASLLAGRGPFPGCGNLISFRDFFGATPKVVLFGASLPIISNELFQVRTSLTVDASDVSSAAPRVFFPLPIAALGLAAGVTDGKPTMVPTLMLAFEVRSDSGDLDFSVSVVLGAFALAGSRARRIRPHPEWQVVQLLVPPFVPPTGSSDLGVFDAWSVDTGFPSDAADKSRFFRFAALALFIRSQVPGEASLELRRLRISVGSEVAPWFRNGHPLSLTQGGTIPIENPNGESLHGWHLQPLGAQVVSVGGQPSFDGLPDVAERALAEAGDFVSSVQIQEVLSTFGKVEAP